MENLFFEGGQSMCGIAGSWSATAVASEGELRRLGDLMASAIAHRGPDGQGIWTDAQAGVVLAHRRLAIIDLTPTGEQPMRSARGRFVIVFNGEIYNHLELRVPSRRQGSSRAGAGRRTRRRCSRRSTRGASRGRSSA